MYPIKNRDMRLKVAAIAKEIVTIFFQFFKFESFNKLEVIVIPVANDKMSSINLQSSQCDTLI